MFKTVAVILMSATALAGCASKPDLPTGEQAYLRFPPPRPGGDLPAYRIGPFDTIAVTVFQEPDLSVRDVQVDAGGQVLLPLIGQTAASGLTSTELAAIISRRLQTKYLQNPQVAVIVQDSVSQKVTVEGSVTEPGVYAIRGRTTLLDAVAMAKGATRVAALDQAVVFRESDGKPLAAMFNLEKIRRGEEPNPEILGNDTVVLGLSNLKAAWRDILTASPLVAAARP